MTTLPTTRPEVAAQLDLCTICGKHGWHTADKCPASWRDYTDELTEGQIQGFEHWEQLRGWEGGYVQEAQKCLRDNALIASWEPLPDNPPEATKVDEWRVWSGEEGTVYRFFTVFEQEYVVDRTVGICEQTLDIALYGVQYGDGTVKRWVSLRIGDDAGVDLDATQALNLASVLADAGDQLRDLT